MADADEDIIPRGAAGADDQELSDETQDFRFLASLSRQDAAIPKRGEKDFEPHETLLQADTLAASRQAMHNALSYPRVHNPKGYNVAIYHPESNMAYTINPKGPLFAKMGQVRSGKKDPLGDDAQRGQRLWLLPEEVLYLLERGTLDVRWPATEDDAEGDLGLPMSLQGAYAMFLGDETSHDGGLTFERYSVYSGLKRLGYTVQRASTWNSNGSPLTSECYAPAPIRTWRNGLGFSLLWKAVSYSWSRQSPAKGSGDELLLRPGVYRGYASVYRQLALISFHDTALQYQPTKPESASLDPKFRVTYHVWKPGSTTFKKSAPGTPDFRIAVVNARETQLPDLLQLGTLMETMPYEPPKHDGNLYGKLKHGYKSVILAVVDQGIVSYLRIADAVFGREKLYERVGKLPGGKRGGGRGGRGGRGRCRGR